MRRKIVLSIISLLWFGSLAIYSQESSFNESTKRKLDNYFVSYRTNDFAYPQLARMTGYNIDNNSKIITLYTNDYFSLQNFDKDLVEKIYKKIRKQLPDTYDNYKIKVVTNGLTIDQLIVKGGSGNQDVSGLWGDIDYQGKPWVQNVSKPNKVTQGLYDRHLSITPSHGRYFDQNKERWEWQRPNIFCTTEDLFTQTIVMPFLIPMLENAGACVFSARERDWQTNEIIVDNNGSSDGSAYQEYAHKGQWETTEGKDFAYHKGDYLDNENPFETGTSRMMKTTKSNSKISFISYKPCFPEDGKYAVYVSYQTLPKSIDDAEYIVYHKGQETHFRVNQQMGGSTWVYLGSFDFDKGINEYNRVVLTNQSSTKGMVTSDAVRFGGGMGNIQRGGKTSGYPRAIEGARYYAQWAGAPYSVYSSKGGTDDYGDDINVRSYLTNWLAGGSVYVPALDGKSVPLDLSLAVHSDAGFSRNEKEIIGTLSICTTNFNDGKLNSGISRNSSKVFATSLLNNVYDDILFKYKNWSKRYVFDRNYSETKNPEVPSAILETLSHQNFNDMKMAQDPNFKFTMARAIYKTILKFEASQHGCSYAVEPLEPQNFKVEFIGGNKVKLSWTAQEDPQERTASPTSYNIYTSTGKSGFDNGVNTGNSSTSYIMELEPDVLYNFKITAVNKGGESFPTEVLSAVFHSPSAPTILIVNGFHRLSAPAVVDNDTTQGFDLDADPGVPYGLYAGWNGRQINFNKDRMGIEGPNGLGYGGDELAGKFIAGNDFNYVMTHAQAIASSHEYNLVSCSSYALESGKVNLQPYACVDFLLGLEKYNPSALKYYKTFTPQIQKLLTAYTANKGRLLVSGSYIGSDMQTAEEQAFLSNVLKLSYSPTDSLTTDANINGLGLSFSIYRELNKEHYSATHPEVLHPIAPSYCAMQYADGTSAAVAYKDGNSRSFTMGFPFECITSEPIRNSIMQGIMNFLMK
jgi:hypothetical protein